jgi:hypothetical protein
MNPPISQGTVEALVFVAFIGFIILRRTYLLTQGVRVSVWRLVALPVVYVAIYAIELGAIGYAGVGSSVADDLYISFAVDAALVVAGTFVAYGYTLRHVTLYHQEGDSEWSYRLGALLPVVYVVLFFVRVAIELVVLGESPFNAPTTQSSIGVSTVVLYFLFAVDALWGVSTGFLVGRSVAVYHEWQERRKETVVAPATALP